MEAEVRVAILNHLPSFTARVPEHHNLQLMSDRFHPLSFARLCPVVPNNETENLRTKFQCSAFA